MKSQPAHSNQGVRRCLAPFFVCRALSRGHFFGENRRESVVQQLSHGTRILPAFRAAFQDGDILLTKAAEVLDDLRAFKLEQGIAKIPEGARTKDKKGEQRHGDAGIVLAHYASRQAPVVYDCHRLQLREADDPRPREIRVNAGFGLRRSMW